MPVIVSPHDESEHPAELVDGELRHVNNNLGKPIHPTAEGRANFHKWFKGSRAVDHHGRPLVLYHGTTKNFATFSMADGNPENDHGVGIYASSSRDDVNHNYATGEGPDLKNKIERDFENESNDVDDAQHDALRAHIAARYKDHEGATLPIYVRMKNPIIIDHDRSTHIPSSKVKRILKSYEDQANSGDHDDIKHAEAAMQIMDHHDGDGVAAHHFIELAKGSGKPRPYHGYGRPEQDPPFAYVARTDDGKISGNEVVRKGFEDAGYDGIIDKTAGTRFTTMAGTDEDTTHYIAFDPKQVKSAIGNKGKFSKRKANVTEHLLGRIDAFLTLNESKAGDLAVSLLKKHDLVPDGVNPEHIAKGIASRHGIPMNLVPQVVHGIVGSSNTSYGKPLMRLPREVEDAHEVKRMRKVVTAGTEFMKDFARFHNGEEWVTPGKDSPIGERGHTAATVHYYHHQDTEGIVDRVRNWHELATNQNKETHLGRALDRYNDLDDHEAKANFHAVHSGQTEHPSEPYIKDFYKRLTDYNPLKKETWHPAHDPAVESGSGHAQSYLAGCALKSINDSKGLNIPYTPDHEHTHNGTTYRAYTLDTPEKANKACWGEKFCIATGESASRMNEHYHGGTYKASHIITKMGKGDDGKPKETLHAAYLPELLPGEQHEDPQQAVRNSGNNGHITGKAFDAIHPLLSKLDSRIDAVSSHYSKAE